MYIAVTGATGFLGRYIVRQLVECGHRCRCWFRPTSDRSGMEDLAGKIDWVAGALEQPESFAPFCRDADAVVHSALFRLPGRGFRAAGQEAFDEFVGTNLLGSLRLMHAAKAQRVGRFVYISTCAVHEVILPDHPLDETHPLWPMTHYGAHKAAVEKFIHAWGLGENWPICALRPTGIYGLAHPPMQSRWFDVVRRVCQGESFRSDRGGKEVHAADVARAVELLLNADADRIRGRAFNCYDMYISEQAVATLARDISGSAAEVSGHNHGPKHQIDTTRIRNLGMTFGGEVRLKQTIEQLVDAAQHL